MAASSKVTSFCRIKVTHICYIPKHSKRSYLLKHKYKSLAYAKQKAAELTKKMHDVNGKLVHETQAIVISHTATTPVH